jgi:membrane-associated protein
VILDLILHLDRHLVELVARYDTWIYAILFAIIFAETGFVVTPFLPGDSLLFGVGALAAVGGSGKLPVSGIYLLLVAAAAAGNTLNYAAGRLLGRQAFSGRYRFFRLEYLQRTEAYFERHGGITVLLSRFTLRPSLPASGTCRTFASRPSISGERWPGWHCFYSAAMRSVTCRG